MKINLKIWYKTSKNIQSLIQIYYSIITMKHYQIFIFIIFNNVVIYLPIERIFILSKNS